MQTNREPSVCRRTSLAHAILAAALTLFPAALTATAQRPPAEPTSVKILHLTNVTNQNDANEILIALRNILNPDTTRMYLLASQEAIVIKAEPEEIALAQKLIGELDRPRKLFRLTYTVTTMDGSKPLNTEHYSMVVASGQRSVMKEGNRIPIVTGSDKTDSSAPQTQFQYVDVGMNFDTTAVAYADGVWLRTKVEQSGLADEKSSVGTDPVLRQTVVEGSSALTSGKPLVLDSLDMPGTTHHMKIEVTAEPLP
jgi:type II secretory pathway component GspD/PulD (secretin)